MHQSHQLQKIPEWLNFEQLKDIAHKNKINKLRYQYSQEIIAQFNKNIYLKKYEIILPEFCNIPYEEIMILGNELVERFPKLYLAYPIWELGKIIMDKVKFIYYDPKLFPDPEYFIIKINFED